MPRINGAKWNDRPNYDFMDIEQNENNAFILLKSQAENLAKTGDKLADFLERLTKSPAILYSYRSEATTLVEEWRNA